MGDGRCSLADGVSSTFLVTSKNDGGFDESMGLAPFGRSSWFGLV